MSGKTASATEARRAYEYLREHNPALPDPQHVARCVIDITPGSVATAHLEMPVNLEIPITLGSLGAQAGDGSKPADPHPTGGAK